MGNSSQEHYFHFLNSLPNPFKLNGFSHYYQLDQSIFFLRVVGWYYSFYSNLNRTSYKQTVESLIRRHILRRLIWVYTVCLCPTKRMLGLYGLMGNFPFFCCRLLTSFFKIIFFKKYFQEHYQSVKQFRSRPSFCQS